MKFINWYIWLILIWYFVIELYKLDQMFQKLYFVVYYLLLKINKWKISMFSMQHPLMELRLRASVTFKHAWNITHKTSDCTWPTFGSSFGFIYYIKHYLEIWLNRYSYVKKCYFWLMIAALKVNYFENSAHPRHQKTICDLNWIISYGKKFVYIIIHVFS